VGDASFSAIYLGKVRHEFPVSELKRLVARGTVGGNQPNRFAE